ncbi:hypothetical protein GCM10010276_86740 [Streptomyces longisporus]|uniref:Integral membrane protein n=1 Tax=Streptomyces longisporus TaxID=1948 RepID=A0ABP6ASP2_STRLO
MFAVLALLWGLTSRGHEPAYRRSSRLYVTGTAVCAVILVVGSAARRRRSNAKARDITVLPSGHDAGVIATNRSWPSTGKGRAPLRREDLNPPRRRYYWASLRTRPAGAGMPWPGQKWWLAGTGAEGGFPYGFRSGVRVKPSARGAPGG